MKETHDSPRQRQTLPERARQWMDEWHARMRADLDTEPRLKAILEQLDDQATRLQLPQYSVTTFRDLHYLKFPDTSVAGLSINDAEFLEVISAGVYTLDDLAEKLKKGEISSPQMQSLLQHLKR